MKIVGYLRVSTDRQAEKGLGLDVQQEAIKKWARTHSHRILTLHTDEGVSGSNGLETRVGLLDCVEDIRAGRAKGLVVYRLDRLARDLILQEQILSEVRRLGGDVFSTSTAEAGYLSDDPEDPSRKLIRQVLGAVAEYERAMIVLRMKAGRRRKGESGGFAYGSPPLGFRSESGQLVPDEEEQRVVGRIQELRRLGASTRVIAAALTEEGLRTKRGGLWYSATVAAVIRRLEGE